MMLFISKRLNLFLFSCVFLIAADVNASRNTALISMQNTVNQLYVDGDNRAAKESILKATSIIESVYTGGHERTQKAKSKWHNVDIADFKGDPYERGMAYFYLGVMDLIDADYGNAQASFSTGLMHDQLNSKDKVSDFYSLHLMKAVAYELLGNTEHLRHKYGEQGSYESIYKNLHSAIPNFSKPDTKWNTIVILETGKAPRKIPDGVGHWKTVYRKGKKFQDIGAEVTINGSVVPLNFMDDIFWQAASRDNRPIDAIVKGKAVFKEKNYKSASTMAQIGETASLYSAFGSGLGAVGGAFALAGAVQSSVAGNVKEKADTRYWKNLPNRLHIGFTNAVNLNSTKVNVKFLDKNGAVVNVPTFKKQLFKNRDGYNIILIKSWI